MVFTFHCLAAVLERRTPLAREDDAPGQSRRRIAGRRRGSENGEQDEENPSHDADGSEPVLGIRK